MGQQFAKKPFENNKNGPFTCRRVTTKVRSKSVDAFHALVILFLFAKEKSVSHVFIYMKRLRAFCFHVLHNGFVRWMRPQFWLRVPSTRKTRGFEKIRRGREEK
jgi:hypothetical protein